MFKTQLQILTRQMRTAHHCCVIIRLNRKQRKRDDDDDEEEEQGAEAEKVPTNDQKWECQINAMNSERREQRRQQREMRAELSLKWFTSSLPRNNQSHSEYIRRFTRTNQITSIFNIQLDLVQCKRTSRRPRETICCSKFSVCVEVRSLFTKASSLTCSEFSNTQWRWESKTLRC